MENADVVQALSEMADLLELTEGNAFKVRAYRQAAQVIDTLPGPVSELWRKGQLTDLPAIGKGIAGKIGELLDRGEFADHHQLARQVPMGILELLKVEGIGPKTAAAAWHGLGICSLEALEEACRTGAIRAIPRMGPVRVKSMLEAIDRYRVRGTRMPLHRALFYAEGIERHLRRLPGVLRVETAGSLRRRKETVGDLDVLVASSSAEPVMRAFVHMKGVEAILAEGPTKSSVRLHGGLQVDLRVLPPESFGAAMHYFTGSKSHNIALRTRAVRMGLKVSEYGVFDRSGHRLTGTREEDVFEAVGLPFIPPELREGAGELEAAEKGLLPKLVEESEILGDLHVHSDASSDAKSSLEELAAEAASLGRQYLAITDHSKSRPLGLDEAALRRQIAQVEAWNRRGRGPRLLTGVEVDILPDGSLDLPLALLRRLDWVVASIHAHFRDPAAKTTERLIMAMRSGVVDVIGHPTGRQLGKRDAYPFDLERVLEVAAKEGVAMEVNAMPDRLDLDDKGCRLAKQAGVRVVIDSDAHNSRHLANLRYGVWVARRGWLEKRDILNTLPVARLLRSRRHEPRKVAR